MGIGWHSWALLGIVRHLLALMGIGGHFWALVVKKKKCFERQKPQNMINTINAN
jgi:hypothetical protein